MTQRPRIPWAGALPLALLAGCGGTQSPAVSESAPTSAPSLDASPAAAIAEDGLAVVLADDLEVRTAPGTGAESAVRDARLARDDRLFIVDGPAEEDGRDWYLVTPLARPGETDRAIGWVPATDEEGSATLESAAAACPADATLASVLALHPYERIVCFGDGPIQLRGPVVLCGIADGPLIFEPEWLSGLSGCGIALDDSGERALIVRSPPGQPGFDPAGAKVVTGHFSDAAAATCSVRSADPAYPAPEPALAVLDCRTQFVLDSVP